MTRVVEKTSKIRDLRDMSGKSAQAVADAVAAILGKGSMTGAAIFNIENRGTRDHYVIKALAEVYGVEPDYIAEITHPSLFQNNLL